MTERGTCFHCGDVCDSHAFELGDKKFCCQGCLQVYQLLNTNELDNYYCLNEKPGQKIKVIPKEKFSFLDEESIVQQLLSFRNKEQAQVSLYLPQMHCSSCLWLLENLSQINDNILSSQVNFNQKTVKIVFKIDQFSLRQLAELLAHIGYEPVIDLHGEKENAKKYSSKRAYLKLGITGFCMGNIMLIAFPEYVGLDPAENPDLNLFFNVTNVLLSIPVVFYGAQEFFINAWYSFRQKYINIDAPIALAIAVTYLRSLYEVFSGTGGGFFDSLASITFFMLLGRTLQNRSNASLKFNRDYKSYFPIAVTKITEGIQSMVKLEDIQKSDILFIHHQEVVPTDCLLSKGNAKIDYSFVTGEDKAETIEKGEIIYAGGRNIGETVEVVAVKSFNQNSFTTLWNNEAFQRNENDRKSRITVIGRFFAFVTIITSLSAFIYWTIQGDSQIAWQAATAVLIIACPCSLLLTASFTNGYVLQLFSKFGCYLKNALVLENMGSIDYIAFDKTGTLTEPSEADVAVEINTLNEEELSKVISITSQSLHPLSRAITRYFGDTKLYKHNNIVLQEITGKGIEANINGDTYRIGSATFTNSLLATQGKTSVFVSINNEIKAHFSFDISLIPGTEIMIQELTQKYEISLISGDNTSSKERLLKLFGKEDKLNYCMRPEDKLEFVKSRQQEGKKVMMIGDGLNDAGALQQSDVGVSVVKSSFAFSPSCDVIMDVTKLHLLPSFLQWAKGTKRLINIGFGFSILFNIFGLSFALTGGLTPLVAAILMPSSTLTIISIAYFGSRRMIRVK
ncbi:MAG: heavy metal translocating P-type ATPase metal-binding domain-containing protein [Brumimicrobium sp.]|nr:heavy metal translocating P-type ATPase metal-binding domain-containing protein [Brumimicrobium sp.]